ncbi:MAG: phosphatidylglycerophosphatase A, partial [Alphaproteobacteria bacterium]
MAGRRPVASITAEVLATWFLVGRAGIAPGTWGSLAALPFGWAILALGSPVLLAGAATGLFIVGT